MYQRNLKLSPRKEKKRIKKPTQVVHFRLNDILQHFNENLKHIRALFTITEVLTQDDKSDNARTILSSQIVLLESAYDFYLHELTKYGLYEILSGN